MNPHHGLRLVALALAAIALPAAVAAQGEGDMSRARLIQDALSAAPVGIALDATVMGWDETVLKQGSNGWTCFPSPPETPSGPMCLDGPWMQWAQGWMARDPVEVDRVGIAYMLHGDSGSSNTDPFAEGPTPDNAWVVEGPHLMVIVPDLASLEGLSTDPHNGGPYVMWAGTPFAHIMVPIN